PCLVGLSYNTYLSTLIFINVNCRYKGSRFLFPSRRSSVLVALFAAAKRYVEQRPVDKPDTFPEHVLDSDIADDLLAPARVDDAVDRKSTRLNSSHVKISYAVFCLKKKKRK